MVRRSIGRLCSSKVPRSDPALRWGRRRRGVHGLSGGRGPRTPTTSSRSTGPHHHMPGLHIIMRVVDRACLHRTTHTRCRHIRLDLDLEDLLDLLDIQATSGTRSTMGPQISMARCQQAWADRR